MADRDGARGGDRRRRRTMEQRLRASVPTREGLARSRWLAPFAHRVLRPELWRFTRRSVPRGVALGLMVGIIVPFAQIVVAALLALPARANIPVAAIATFITNPLTTPLVWIAAYHTGSFMLRIDAMTFGSPVGSAVRGGEIGGWIQWLTGAASITAFGLVVLGVVTAAIGYLVASWAWRWRVWLVRRRLARQRGAR